jgi:neutral trehalase
MKKLDKQTKLFANNSWILHQDNAPAHIALSVREFLATKQTTVSEHPAYSPDLSHQLLFSVPEDKGNIKRKAIYVTEDIRSNTMAALKAIPQNQFQNCFEGWTMRWHWCIASQGEYFEDNHGGIQQ